MRASSVPRWTAVVVAAVLLASCATAKGKSTSSGATSAGGNGALAATARGVSASTIKVGFSYIDLAALARTGIIKIDHGPYEQIIKALVDDVNASGGINGRKLQLFTAKYSPLGNTDQLAACTQLTEDDQVFVVLNGLLTDNNLCIVQQHQTALIGGTTTALTAANLAKARAPWASPAASTDRSIDALVKVLEKNGKLQGHTVGVYAAQPENKPLVSEAARVLTAAGYPPAVTALNDAETDLQAATQQDKVIAQRMTNAHVDTVIDVGLFIPASDFDSVGFHPSIYTLDAGNIAAAAFTNPLGKFPIVAGLAATADPNAAFKTAAFKHCVEVWKQATGKDIQTTLQEDIAGKSSGNTAMQIACTTLQIFVAGAKAAGPNLTNATLQTGIESLGHVELANATVASFGPNKLDGQDSFQLNRFDPTWKHGQGKSQLVPVGQPLVLNQ